MSESTAESPQGSAAGGPETVAQKAAAQLVQTDDFMQYMLKSKSEMFSVFRGMAESVTQCTIFFNESRDMLLTSIVSYGDNGIIFDFGPSEETNRKALQAEKLFCVALLDKVKIQFILHGLTRIEHQGRPAFRTELPDGVLRLQRREYFRLATPITKPLKCIVPYPGPGGRVKPTEILVADISGGGLGLTSIPNDTPFERGMEFATCKIDLPEVGLVTVNLTVRNVFETTSRSGAKIKRAGCEFNRLSGPMLTLIQRYIIKIERERKAKESGMN